MVNIRGGRYRRLARDNVEGEEMVAETVYREVVEATGWCHSASTAPQANSWRRVAQPT